MKKLAWCTDIHLDHSDGDKVEGFTQEEFMRKVEEQKPDALLICGDIAEGTTVSHHMNWMENRFGFPTYFVLGNHDYYRSSFEKVRAEMTSFTKTSKRTKWLPALSEPARITDDVCVIGHDGWYDGRFGDYHGSRVELNDFHYIHDFISIDGGSSRLALMRKMADQAAEFLGDAATKALKNFKQVIVVTHVPPFKEASTYRGKPANDSYLPFFSCKSTGEALVEVMSANPDRQMMVLCGHTHEGPGQHRILPNLTVVVGAATYGKPELQEPLMVG
jgi:predicted MPP superfamily phosphohydrolase